MASFLSGLNFGGKGSNFGSAFSDFGGAVSDLFAGQGDKAEAQNYQLAATLATQNEQYTELSTAIKNQQTNREVFEKIGGQTAAIASSGFTTGGSGGDLLRESASQGALSHATLSEQGYMQEQGYKEQAQSYTNMANAAENASTGADIGGIIKGVAGVAALIGF